MLGLGRALGETIATVGSTGNASPEAPHLHFEVLAHGHPSKFDFARQVAAAIGYIRPREDPATWGADFLIRQPYEIAALLRRLAA